MIQVYTGDGKGKTTAALGQALRALGQGKKVCLIQFMKKGDFGEVKALKKFKNITVKQFGRRAFVNFSRPSAIDRKAAREALAYAGRMVKEGRSDLVILDEINVAAKLKLIAPADILKLIKGKSLSTEIILTGRGACGKILEQADLVTEMRAVKHYFNQGVRARKGIEY
ncbi:MAG: cob(I)yrinic acid a,c-diamide adenosyltransferase [Patescibacteria group bacterium]